MSWPFSSLVRLSESRHQPLAPKARQTPKTGARSETSRANNTLASNIFIHRQLLWATSSQFSLLPSCILSLAPFISAALYGFAFTLTGDDNSDRFLAVQRQSAGLSDCTCPRASTFQHRAHVRMFASISHCLLASVVVVVVVVVANGAATATAAAALPQRSNRD